MDRCTTIELTISANSGIDWARMMHYICVNNKLYKRVDQCYNYVQITISGTSANNGIEWTAAPASLINTFFKSYVIAR